MQKLSFSSQLNDSESMFFRKKDIEILSNSLSFVQDKVMNCFQTCETNYRINFIFEFPEFPYYQGFCADVRTLLQKKYFKLDPDYTSFFPLALSSERWNNIVKQEPSLFLHYIGNNAGVLAFPLTKQEILFITKNYAKEEITYLVKQDGNTFQINLASLGEFKFQNINITTENEEVMAVPVANVELNLERIKEMTKAEIKMLNALDEIFTEGGVETTLKQELDANGDKILIDIIKTTGVSNDEILLVGELFKNLMSRIIYCD